jgi:hypothetical protein
MRNYLKKAHQKTNDEQLNFYTPLGIHVYIQQPLLNDSVDLESVVNKVESILPAHLLSEVEMIIVGWFEEFEKQDINAFYKDGALYISNIQDDEADMCDDIIHEVAHAIEESSGYTIYADNKIKDEFLRKRQYLHDILWKHGYKAPIEFFTNLEYNKEFDEFLHKKIGYNKLSGWITGLFISPYAATALREYFATGFTDYYMHPDEHRYLQKVSPAVYKKIITLQDEELLDITH